MRRCFCSERPVGLDGIVNLRVSVCYVPMPLPPGCERQERELQEGLVGAPVRDRASLPDLLRPVRLRTERVDEGGGRPGLRQRNQRKNANRSLEDGGRTANRG